MRWIKAASLITAGFLFLMVSAIGGMVLTQWWRYHTLEKSIIDKMDQYYLNLTVSGREEYLLESDEIFEVPYMTSKFSQAATPTRILDAQDKLIAEFSVEKGQYLRSTDEIPAYLKKARVASEDAHFYNHRGIDWKATVRAVIVSLSHARRQQGGSTLTQQLAKQMFTTRKKSLGRKVFEFFCVRKIEQKYTKDQILLMYLNFAYFGHGCFGIESAARYYFGKPAAALEVGESAMLVGIIPNPNKYSPLDAPELAKARLRTVLKRMSKNGFIPESGLERIENEFWSSYDRRMKTPEVSFWRTRVNEAPYVVEFVRRQMLKSLTKERLLKGGLTIRTTFDLDAQKAAQQALSERLAKENDPQAQPDEDGEPAGKQGPVEGALVALRPQDGALLAMVGGSGFTFQNQLDRAMDGRRLMGSSVKPFVYAVAFESGKVKPEDKYLDAPISFPIANGKKWSPHNYGNKYFGDVRLDFALWKSLNSVAIKLLRDIDIDAVREALSVATNIPLPRWPRNLTLALGTADLAPVQMAQAYAVREALSVATNIPLPRWPRNLTLALGTADLAPVQMAQAYAVFANGGHAVRPWWLRSVSDRSGNLIRGQAQNEVMPTVFKPETCKTMIEVMKGVLGPEGSAYASARRVGFNIPAAGKTGTTNDYRDAWFSGVTPDIAATVWIGHDDGVPMSPGKAGGSISAPVWMQFVKSIYLSRPTHDF